MVAAVRRKGVTLGDPAEIYAPASMQSALRVVQDAASAARFTNACAIRTLAA